MWGIVDFFKEPAKSSHLEKEEVESMIIARAKEIAAIQKVLKELNSQEKADLHSKDQARKEAAGEKLRVLKERFLESGKYKVVDHDIRQATNDIYQDNKELIGVNRENYIAQIDEDRLLKSANSDSLKDLDLSDEI